MYPYTFETAVKIATLPAEIFSFLDEHRNLASHMNKRSWMMAGGSMSVKTDALQGKVVGSHLYMEGSILGIALGLDEVVTERTPPWKKAWETVGSPRLLIIGAYEMGFQIREQENVSEVTFHIRYRLPATGFFRWLGKAVGPFYARWCTRKMAKDTVQHFAGSGK